MIFSGKKNADAKKGDSKGGKKVEVSSSSDSDSPPTPK